MTLEITPAALIRHLISLSAALGIFWSAFVFVAEPRAQDYIEAQIKKRLVAENAQLKKSVENANRNVEQTKQEIRLLRSKSDKAEAKLDNIEQLQRQLLQQFLQVPPRRNAN